MDFVTIKKICEDKNTIPIQKLEIDPNLHRTNKVKDTTKYLQPSDFDSLDSEKFKNEVREYIESIYDRNIVYNYVVDKSSCDVFITEFGIGFKFLSLFEYSEINVNKLNQITTYNDFTKNNLRIIQIFEDSWLAKKEIIKSRINNLLGKSNIIYARKCKVKIINDSKIVGEFLDKAHLQGKIGSAVKLGLYHNDKLVSIMTFGSLRKNLGQKSTSDSYELLRFCNILDYNVVGGASKLFNYFVNTYKPNSIISYADKCWSNSQDNIYTKLGLKYVHESDPSYFYIIGTQRKGRFGYRKDQLLLCGYDGSFWGEHTICLSNNIFRIFDVGTCKYEWSKLG